MKAVEEIKAQAEVEIRRALGDVPPEIMAFLVTSYCAGYVAGIADERHEVLPV